MRWIQLILKMKKGKKLVSFLVNFYTISITIVFLATSCYLFVASSDLKKPELVKNPEIYASEIYDINGNVIQKVGKSQGQIKYEELPQSLLNAIVAIEDTTFFYHDGVDIHRVAYKPVNTRLAGFLLYFTIFFLRIFKALLRLLNNWPEIYF